jgi:autotransporter-associated beta strand protein
VSGTTPGNAGTGNGAAGIVILRYAGSDATGVTGGTAVTGTGSAAGFMLQQFTTTGTSTLTIDFNARLGATLTGTISGGSDGMTFHGPGRLTLVADNTYTGATTVSAGTLAIGNGGTTGSVAGNLVTNAAVIFNRSDTVSYTGVISGTGWVTKQGAGNLVLSGTSSHTGATSVAAGRLSVNGALGDSAVMVSAAAELGGSGSIGGPVNVASGGTLAPGNSIESLATGTATFAAGATFAYEVDSTNPLSLGSAADLLVVNGDLNLDPANGSLLSVTDLAGSPNPFIDSTTVFALINYSGAWNGGLFTYGGNVLADDGLFTVGSQQWRIDYNSATGGVNFTGDYLASSSFVTVTAVPEPSTYATALAGLACGGYTMFRRRKRA